MELENEADFFIAEAGEGGVVKLGSIFAVDENAAGRIDGAAVLVESGRSIETAQEIEQRALSRAAGADDGDVFPGVNLQVDTFEDVVDGIAGAEVLVEVFGTEKAVGAIGGFSAGCRDCQCHGDSFRSSYATASVFPLRHDERVNLLNRR